MNAPSKRISTHSELVGVAGRWWQYKSSGGDGNVGTSNKINQLYFRKSVQVNWLDQNWMSENYGTRWFEIKSRLIEWRLVHYSLQAYSMFGVYIIYSFIIYPVRHKWVLCAPQICISFLWLACKKIWWAFANFGGKFQEVIIDALSLTKIQKQIQIVFKFDF